MSARGVLGVLEHSTFGSEREDLFAEFMRLLAAAQDGGSSVAECLLAASRWERDDGESWHREWSRLAETSRERGDAALADGHVVSAQRNWLRAMNYFAAAILPLDPEDERRQVSINAMRSCARNVLRHRQPAGEVVSLPWLRDHSLQGYFLPARCGPAPAVICIGEPGHRKEEFLFKLAPHAQERGLAMLAIDLHGEQDDDRLGQIIGRADLESSISYVVDYLSSRNDVDRIAILADGCSSSFVARAAAREPRLAAAVCDGSLWDLQERDFLARRAALRRSNLACEREAGMIARNIACPVLITLGQHGWLKVDRVRQLVRQLRTCGLDVTLKVFTTSETASAQGHADNPGLANEYIFDWLTSRLNAPAAQYA